jgi:hypothetical protein
MTMRMPACSLSDAARVVEMVGAVADVPVADAIELSARSTGRL